MYLCACQQQRNRVKVACAASEKPASSQSSIGGDPGVSIEVEIGDLQSLAATEPDYRHAPAIGAEHDKVPRHAFALMTNMTYMKRCASPKILLARDEMPQP
ncbi:hypothetical protein SNK03_003340 [Fusarium graminearum]|uniref:Chromosome 1, complete genome n=1 Tax=Gibberella zeae (strain ATCC MYA-4620 / CBS 123657 / FGSC 9075 / NRRL 31084 / PH-1) TaxID=229533 RepID=I1S9Z9_GIBZE|nr:hypothetical protein FGSG_13680 [Fusarium graminearum PH-1]ESU16645.1 hypothetical protein FGSG_13680 [Fusarium graminearum PH-1]EYB27011.1 hypothetical protein FG05_13680 [Fusarium graminearum]CEF75309.1 unnamed protein product [Fusarium graminearum]CZS78589.1 unnamed protein product [Fusarium graminearum]|eukprot:XP_011318907.1 hypothetical protein FGSG_13680 [Fusarium graminearum PH-1]